MFDIDALQDLIAPDVFFLLAAWGLSYAVPLVANVSRLIRTTPASAEAFQRGTLQWLGWVEFWGSLARDVSWLLIVLVWWVFSDDLVTSLWVFTLPALGWLVARQHRRAGNRQINDMFERHWTPHPGQLFDYVHQVRSPWPPLAPVLLEELDATHVDFKARSMTMSPFMEFVFAVLETAALANFVLQGADDLPLDRFRRTFDTVGRTWSLRVAYRLRLAMKVEGAEHLEDVKNQTFLAFNHESIIDFCLAFFATGARKTGDGRYLAPRFIAAKDHFKDNPILYSILGIGRAMERSGMIFVDRKTPGAGLKIIEESSQVIKELGVDVAIFPQGTRALGHYSGDGAILGAGYYTTTGRRPVGSGHFRRGLSMMAAELSKTQDVDILPIGIVGAALVIPAKTFSVSAHRTVTYTIGPCFRLAHGAEHEATGLLHDVELIVRRAAHINPRLLERWALELGEDATRLEELSKLLKPWEEAAEPLPFAVMDLIFTKGAQNRCRWLERVYELARDDASLEAWAVFREEISAERRQA